MGSYAMGTQAACSINEVDFKQLSGQKSVGLGAKSGP